MGNNVRFALSVGDTKYLDATICFKKYPFPIYDNHFGFLDRNAIRVPYNKKIISLKLGL